MVSNGPVILFTFGVFLKPISEEYGWSRGQMSLGVTIALILGGLATPGFGILIDRWSIQRVTLIVITLFAISFGLISLTPPNVAVFIGFYAVSGLLAGGHAPLPYAKSISGWFEHSRGLALGIAMAGVGIGIAILPQIARLLMDIVGWRHAYVLIGAIMWLVAFPAVLFLVKDPVISADKARANAAQQIAEEASFAVYGRDFWLIAVAAFLVVTAVNGISAHFIALLTDRGVPAGIAAPMLAAMGVATIVGRLVSGYLLDRVFAPYLAAAVFLVPLIGIVLLLAGVTSTALVVCAAVCFGLSLGAEVDIIGFLVGRYFGLHRYGEIYGYIFAAFTIGSGVGPYLMGVSFDKTGSYNTTLIFFCGALVVASILIALLGEYRYPERRRRSIAETQAVALET
jgi:predicted MFS family arabinose efflux permease